MEQREIKNEIQNHKKKMQSLYKMVCLKNTKQNR